MPVRVDSGRQIERPDAIADGRSTHAKPHPGERARHVHIQAHPQDHVCLPGQAREQLDLFSVIHHERHPGPALHELADRPHLLSWIVGYATSGSSNPSVARCTASLAQAHKPRDALVF